MTVLGKKAPFSINNIPQPQDTGNFFPGIYSIFELGISKIKIIPIFQEQGKS
jgi:hypothetical protein